jgi:hypothetical protein
MKFKLDQPEKVGSFGKQIAVDELEVVSIAFNFDELHTSGKADAKGEPKLYAAITLKHVASGFTHNVVDEQAQELWAKLNELRMIERTIIEHLAAAGQLPAGEIVE